MTTAETRRTPYPPLALFAGGVAFLLPVVFSPSVQATFWTPAAALCLVVAAVGLPRLAALVGSPDGRRPALAAVLFVVVAAVSAVVSPSRLIGFLGLYYWGTGWLFVATLAGAWAIGRSLDGRGAGLVERAIIAAALVNAVVALLETVVDLSPLHLGRFGSRAPGLLGNPIHLGAFCAAALALVTPRLARSPARWAVAAVSLAAASQTSGSRFGIVVAVGVVGWAFAAYGRRVGGLLVVFVALGLVVGTLAAHAGGGSQIASSRVAVSAENGVRPRLDTWRTGLAALGSRPVLGYGPGEFRIATSPRRTIALARAEGPDTLFVDAHNLVVEYAVTTGIVGVLALLAWLALSLRSAGGPLLVFAIADLANHLVEPQAVRTTPVAFLALGAAAAAAATAGAAVTVAPRMHRFVRAVTAPLVAVAVVAGGWLLVGDFHLEQTRLDFSASHARTASWMLPWPESAELRSRVYLYNGRVQRDDAVTARGITWLRTAAERDRTDPTWWHLLGAQLLAAGRLREADAAFATALRRNPVSVLALNGRGYVALAEHRDDDAARWFHRSLAVYPAQRDVRRQLQRIDE